MLKGGPVIDSVPCQLLSAVRVANIKVAGNGDELNVTEHSPLFSWSVSLELQPVQD